MTPSQPLAATSSPSGAHSAKLAVSDLLGVSFTRNWSLRPSATVTGLSGDTVMSYSVAAASIYASPDLPPPPSIVPTESNDVTDTS